MPDITMCKGVGCEIKNECHRHTTTPSRWQSYFLESPILNKMRCDYFIFNGKTKQ
jgi:hypothetical protein